MAASTSTARLLADADCEATRKAREKDVKALGRYLGVAEPGQVLALVVAGTPGQANAIALGYGGQQRPGWPRHDQPPALDPPAGGEWPGGWA